MNHGHWKYLSPKSWELITRVNGVEVNKSSDPKKIAKHLREFNQAKTVKDTAK